MAGTSRFHDKLHRANHHSVVSPGLPDSAYDPIASKDYPFRGDFVLSGALSARNDVTLGGALSARGDGTTESFVARKTLTVNEGTTLLGPVYTNSNGSYVTTKNFPITTSNGPATLTFNYLGGVYINGSPPKLIVGAKGYDAGLVSVTNIDAVSATLETATVSNRLGIGTSNPQHELHVIGDVIIYGTLTANGNSYFQNTLFTTTSSLSIVNTGSGAGLTVSQEGNQPIAAFYDHESTISFWADGHADRPGWIGVKTITPNVEFTVHGDISASGVVYSGSADSNQWKTAYNTTVANSANWGSVYSSIGANSGFWTSNYTSTTANSASWNQAYTTTNETSSVYTVTNTKSADWDHAYSTTSSNSARWESDYVVTNTNSASWSNSYNTLASNSASYTSSYNTTNANSARWTSNYNSTYASSASWDASYVTVAANSASWSGGGAVSTTVTTNSAAWNANYATTSANSASWNTGYVAVVANSASWNAGGGGGGAVYSTVNSLSTNWNNSYNLLTSTSANWSVAYTNATTNSGFWNANYTTTNTNSSNWSSSYVTLLANSGTWDAAAGALGDINLDYLADVSITSNTLADGQVLTYDIGTQQWENSSLVLSSVIQGSSLWASSYSTTNTNSANWNTGYTAYTIITANSATWNTNSLSGSTDVNITTPANNALLQYSTSQGKWINGNTLTTTSTLTAGSIRLTSATVSTFDTAVSASGDFLLININGVVRKLRLWD